MEKVKQFLIVIAMTLFLNLNSVCSEDIRLRHCANGKIYSEDCDEKLEVVAELGSKIDQLEEADKKILVYRIKHNDTQCIYLAANHDESLFQKYLRKNRLGHVAFIHSDRLEKFRIIYQVEEGRFCLENKYTHMKNLIESSTRLHLQNCKEIVEDGTKEIFKLSEKINQGEEAEKKICVFEFNNENFTFPFLHHTQCFYVARLFDEEMFKRYMHKIYVDEYCKEYSNDFMPIGECGYDSFPDSIIYREGVVVIDGVSYLVIFTQEEGHRCKENVLDVLDLN